MSVKQLFNLQCLEQEIAAAEASLTRAQAEIGESPELKKAKANLVEANAELTVIRAEQKTTEYGISDITAKINAANESLYSGRVKNPKELQNLQHDIASLQAQRSPLEERGLSLMEKAEAAEARIKQTSEGLGQVENQWVTRQEHLAAEIEAVKRKLDSLKQKHAESIALVPPSDLALYSQLKRTRGWGVARMEQGTCGRCRLNLSTAEVQRARAGQMVSCSSCGRLLYFE